MRKGGADTERESERQRDIHGERNTEGRKERTKEGTK